MSGATVTAGGATAPHAQLRPRLGIVGRLTDKAVVRTGYALVWIEMAGITTPFTTPVFPFLQSVSQRTLDNLTPAFVLAAGPSIEPIPLTPQAGLGQGVFAVDRDLGSGYVQQWNSSLQRELAANVSVEVAYVGSKVTRVGLPDTNLNQLTAEQLALGPSLLQRVRIRTALLRHDSAIIIARRSTIPLPSCSSPIRNSRRSACYRNNVGRRSITGSTASWNSGRRTA